MMRRFPSEGQFKTCLLSNRQYAEVFQIYYPKIKHLVDTTTHEDDVLVLAHKVVEEVARETGVYECIQHYNTENSCKLFDQLLKCSKRVEEPLTQNSAT